MSEYSVTNTLTTNEKKLNQRIFRMLEANILDMKVNVEDENIISIGDIQVNKINSNREMVCKDFVECSSVSINEHNVVQVVKDNVPQSMFKGSIIKEKKALTKAEQIITKIPKIQDNTDVKMLFEYLFPNASINEWSNSYSVKSPIKPAYAEDFTLRLKLNEHDGDIEYNQGIVISESSTNNENCPNLEASMQKNNSGDYYAYIEVWIGADQHFVKGPVIPANQIDIDNGKYMEFVLNDKMAKIVLIDNGKETVLVTTEVEVGFKKMFPLFKDKNNKCKDGFYLHSDYSTPIHWSTTKEIDISSNPIKINRPLIGEDIVKRPVYFENQNDADKRKSINYLYRDIFGIDCNSYGYYPEINGKFLELDEVYKNNLKIPFLLQYTFSFTCSYEDNNKQIGVVLTSDPKYWNIAIAIESSGDSKVFSLYKTENGNWEKLKTIPVANEIDKFEFEFTIHGFKIYNRENNDRILLIDSDTFSEENKKVILDTISPDSTIFHFLVFVSNLDFWWSRKNKYLEKDIKAGKVSTLNQTYVKQITKDTK